MKKMIVAGNWKMNILPSEVEQFVNNLKQNVDKVNGEVIICVPFLDLNKAIEISKDSIIKVGAQNMHFEEEGAYTGEISPNMLNDINVEYVIIGHSERRQYFAETDEIVNKKVHSALNHKLKPIICVGESLNQREQGITNNILETQITLGLKEVKVEQMSNVIIAYEPIWAIGTGKTATPEDANLACKFIREMICKLYNNDIAQNIVIQYGGSVNSKNAKELFAMPDINGALVGGVSLKVDDFTKIIKVIS